MPNYCECILEIPAEIIDKIVTEVDGQEHLDFDKIIPMPAHQPDITKPNPFWRDGNLGSEQDIFGNDNWFDWSQKNWGTKWNAMESSVNRDVGVIHFTTAWSPPIPIFKHLIDMYPTVPMSLYYDEGGMCFRGKIIYDGAEKLILKDYDWHYDIEVEECPKCGDPEMYTGEGGDDWVNKECSECGHIVTIKKGD